MSRQYLEDGAGHPSQVLRRLCGVQAQVASAAELAVGVRLSHPDRARLGGALGGRAVIKTWAMRGTLHLLPAEAAGAFLALMAALRSWERASWQKTFISAAQLGELIEVAREVLDGAVVSREELVTEVLTRTGDEQLAEHLRSGWGVVLKPLAWQGLLCQVPAEANRVAFSSPRSWAPEWRGLPSIEEAARIAIPAYLGAYGPAPMEAFDRWLSRGTTSRAALRAWFGAATDLLARIDIDGTEAFARLEDVDEIVATRPSRTLRLLPAFDQYVLGPGTGDGQVIPPAHRADVSRAAGWIAPVVVDGGRVTGTWETRDSRLEVALFDGSAVPRDAVLGAEADRIGSLLGRKLTPSLRLR
jgi:hypothetical protein